MILISEDGIPNPERIFICHGRKDNSTNGSYLVNGDTCAMFKTMRQAGFFNLVYSDEAAFRQVLCTSSSHMTSLRNEAPSSEALSLSTNAIVSLNRKLTDPVLRVSDGVIVTVLAFGCHAVSPLTLPTYVSGKKVFLINSY